jgi:HPt (histidine-containing phosphotransfer) domain-containing protein
MITLYQQQSSIYLQDISGAVEVNSQPLWQEHCHKMKGAAGSVGLITLHAMLVEIEKSTASTADKKQYLAKLVQENKVAIQVFYDWLAKQS